MMFHTFLKIQPLIDFWEEEKSPFILDPLKHQRDKASGVCTCPVPWTENWFYSHSSHPRSWADVGPASCWRCCCYCCSRRRSPWRGALLDLPPPCCRWGLYSQRSWSSLWTWTRRRERRGSGSGGPLLPAPPVCVSPGMLAWRRGRGHARRPGIRGRASSGCAAGCSCPDSGSEGNSVWIPGTLALGPTVSSRWWRAEPSSQCFQTLSS